MIDEFGLDFEVEKHILYFFRNAEKDQVLVLSEMVLNDTVPNLYHNSTVVPLSTAFAALLEAAQSQLHVLDTTHMLFCVWWWPTGSLLPWVAGLRSSRLGVGPPFRRSTELLLRISDFGAARSVPPVFSCDFVCFAASLFAF